MEINKDSMLLGKIYDDLLSPALKTAGGTLNEFFKYGDNVFNGLKKYNLIEEESHKAFVDSIKSGYKNIAEENLILPSANIYLQTFDNIHYVFNIDELRSMFEKLLISDMDKSMKEYIHPGFIDIIKQLSSWEAQLLSKLYSKQEYISNLQEIEIRGYPNKPKIITSGTNFAQQELSKYYIAFKLDNFTTKISKKNIELSQDITVNIVDNLIRLGIFTREINIKVVIEDDSNYEEINQKEIDKYISKIGKSELERLEIKKDDIFCKTNQLKLTEFGKSFIKCCVEE